MNLPVTKKLGLTSRADMIDLLSSGEAVFGNETAWALGFEFHQDNAIPAATDRNKIQIVPGNHDAQREPGWTQFQPAPSQYWRVTGYESMQQETGNQKRARGRQKKQKLPDLEEIRKGFNFSLENILKRQPLAEMNYVTTQLRKAAGNGRSRHELDLTAAVDRLSRGQFLYRMPHRARRVWGHDLLCLEDRAQRLIPYWSDQDDVTTALAKLYPETGYTVARLGHGRTVLRIQSPESLYGHECPLPTPGTLVLALTDLGTLAIGDDGPQVREFWADLGRMYLVNGNRAVAMVPCLPEQVPAEVARYWRVIPWERSTSATIVGDDKSVLERLLTVLSVAVRLEPELLRAVRKLLPETRDNPGIESLVWQDDFVASPNSVAADLSAAERKKRVAAFENEPIKVREDVLNLIKEVRQIGYEDVWVSELLGLDAESQRLFSLDVDLAEQQILSLASPGSKVPLDDYAVWLERLDEQLTHLPEMKPEVREALGELVKKIGDSTSRGLSVWMPGRIALNPELPERKVEIRQQGKHLRFERSVDSGATQDAALSTGSLIANLRTRSGEIRIHESHRGHELTEARFWAGDKKPTWVHRFDADEYGPWCSFRVKDVEQKLRWIPPGDFMMGSPEGEEGRYADEGPQHRVKISCGFWMFETPCTQELWSAVMATDPSDFKGKLLPVESVSWDDASTFNDALNRLLPGIGIHLPTEAQWEYACRGPGTDQQKQRSRYGELDEIAWWDGNSGGTTHDVGLKRSNGYGLYDMLGNVWEWCRDHAYRTYDQSQHIDPLYESGDTRSSRVVRGGGWNSSAGLVRAANRYEFPPEDQGRALGFRCLSSPEPGVEPSREAAMSGSKSQRGGSPQDGKRLSPPRKSRSIFGDVFKTSTGESVFGNVFSLTDSQSDREPRVSSSSQWNSQDDSPGIFNASSPVRMVSFRSPQERVLVEIGRSHSMKIETDCEVISLSLALTPKWAVTSGRDKFGLWAEFELNNVRQRLRWIAPGSFLMGSLKSEQGRYADEGPQHPVTISSGFWFFDTPCTQKLWETVMTSNPSETVADEHPVSRVSYNDAIVFTKRLSAALPELEVSLPTEAQWEYCCRAGETDVRYGRPEDISWFSKNSGHSTHPVKTRRPNRWGLFDMLGNVYERCLDRHRIYGATSAIDPIGPISGTAEPVIRGGSWGSHAKIIRAAYRNLDHPAGRVDRIGFRCLSSAKINTSPMQQSTISEVPRSTWEFATRK